MSESTSSQLPAPGTDTGLAACRALFEPASVRTVRLDFHVLRRGGSVLALLPPNHRRAHAMLDLYGAQTRLAKAAKAALRMVLRSGLAPGLSTVSFDINESDPLLQLVREAGGAGDGSPFGILPGSTVEARQRFIFAVFGADNRIARVIKAGGSQHAVALVEREAGLVGALPPWTAGAPGVGRVVRTPRVTALVMDYIRGRTPDHVSSAKLLTFLRSWVRTERDLPLYDLPQFLQLRQKCAHPVLMRMRALLRRCRVHPEISNGDFAPWNIREDANGEWTVLDWERGELDGIPCWNWFHFVMQTRVLVRKLSPEALLAEVEDVLQDRHFQAYCSLCGVAGIERELFLAYLLFVTRVFKPAHGLTRVKQVFTVLEQRWIIPTPRWKTSPRPDAGAVAPEFSVVTPSHNQLAWVKLCAASVADQLGVRVEHIIQDAGTPGIADAGLAAAAPRTAGTQSARGAATPDYRMRLFVEEDSGMYDAINRGFARAGGEIVAWLNCDEQYLPGALRRVADFFRAHPEVDVLFGDALLLDEAGRVLSYRRSVVPSLLHTKLEHLATLSCAMFFRRSLLDRGHFLDTRWKTIADAAWVAGLIEKGVSMAVLHEPLAAFTITRANLGQTSLLFAEMENWRSALPAWQRSLAPLVIAAHRARKLLGGAYGKRDVATALHARSSDGGRREVKAAGVSFGWPDAAALAPGGGATGKPRFTRARSSYEAAFQRTAADPESEKRRLTFWTVAGLASAACVMLLDLKNSGLTVTPFFCSLALLALTFVLPPRRLGILAGFFAIGVLVSLGHSQPLQADQAIDWLKILLRLGSFCIASTLAILLSRHRLRGNRLATQTIEVLRRMPAPVIVSDASGIVKFANRAAGELLGIAPGELEGESYLTLLMGTDDEGTAARIYRTVFERSATVNDAITLHPREGACGELTAQTASIGDRETRLLVTLIHPGAGGTGAPLSPMAARSAPPGR